MAGEIFIDRKKPIIAYLSSFTFVLIVFVGFWAFGGFSSPLASDTCSLPVGFKCLSYSMTPTGAYIAIENVLDENIIIDQISIEGCTYTVPEERLKYRTRKKINLKNCRRF